LEFLIFHQETHLNCYPTKIEHAFSIGFNLWKSTLTNLFSGQICEQNIWKFAKTIRIPKCFAEANVNFEVIRSWWHSSSVESGNDLEELNHWLSFWHFQVE
jgi:hypothetical protein